MPALGLITFFLVLLGFIGAFATRRLQASQETSKKRLVVTNILLGLVPRFCWLWRLPDSYTAFITGCTIPHRCLVALNTHPNKSGRAWVRMLSPALLRQVGRHKAALGAPAGFHVISFTDRTRCWKRYAAM